MNDDKQRVDLLEEIINYPNTPSELVEQIKLHFVLVPIQDLPRAVKHDYKWGTEYMVGGFLIQPESPIEADLIWNGVLDSVAAIRFQQEMAEHNLSQRRDQLIRELMPRSGEGEQPSGAGRLEPYIPAGYRPQHRA